MREGQDLVANIEIPGEVFGQLASAPLEGVTLERVPGEAPSHRFGIAEAVLVVGLAKGVLELVKLSIEIRDRLAKSAPTRSARVSAPGAVSWVEVNASMADGEIEDAIRAHFG
jgi:hypothetical protein